MITDIRIADFIESFDEPLSNCMKEMERYAEENYVPIIKKPTRTLMRFLLHMHKPMQILEVGTAIGFSAIYMSQFLQEGAHITTIEKVPARIRDAKDNIKKNKKEDVITLLEGDATEVLEMLKNEGKTFDFIFMDAAKGQYLNFFPTVEALLKKDGLLVSDNVLQDGDVVESRYAVTRRNRTIHMRMRDYLYTLTHTDTLDTVILPLGDGVTLSTKIEENRLEK
ncbi:MAG: O-methyltransferase [Lachnospiraceae bacterium]|nr:O-methyltransferase [Lachnospiraceae bacterium]